MSLHERQDRLLEEIGSIGSAALAFAEGSACMDNRTFGNATHPMAPDVLNLTASDVLPPVETGAQLLGSAVNTTLARGPVLSLPAGSLVPGGIFVFELAVIRNPGALASDPFPLGLVQRRAYAVVGAGLPGSGAAAPPRVLLKVSDSSRLVETADALDAAGRTLVNPTRRILLESRLVDAVTGQELPGQDNGQLLRGTDALVRFDVRRSGDAAPLQGVLSAGERPGKQLVGVVRPDGLEAGATYTCAVTVSSSSGQWTVRASVDLETNAPPSSGFIDVGNVAIDVLAQGDGL